MSEHQLRSQAKVRSAFEVRPLLDQISVAIGALHGVVLHVTHTPDGLFFTNELGDLIRDGAVHCVCCTDEEVASGEFMLFFTPRCFRAALAQAFAQDFVRRQFGGTQ